MEDIDFHSIPAKVLNYSSRLLLGKYLNPEQNVLSGEGYARDYRGLAEQMDFGYNDIKNFQRHEDPTMQILDAWTMSADATIAQLVEFLENMGRHDVIQDLKPRFENDSKLYLQQLESCQNNPVQVPEVSSCRPQSSSLDELNILTRDDAYTGECTLYDAYISYADEDIGFVYNLTRYLEDAGFKLFIRSRDLLAGHSEYETNMQLIKERYKRVLIVLTPSFLKCPACEVQASFAAGLGFVERCRKIIPILWKPCEIPLILKFVSRIDFTNQDIKVWAWENLKSSLRDVPSSLFISNDRPTIPSYRTQPQPEICQSSASGPAITYPSSSLSAASSNPASTQSCVASDSFQDDNSSDSASTLAKSAPPPKQRNKMPNFRFWQSKKPVGNDAPSLRYSSETEHSSNITSGFHSQSGNGLESVENVNGFLPRAPLEN